jgi:hypothetical protein
MMRGWRSTLALVVVCGGLFGYIYVYESDQTATPADQAPLAYNIESDALEEIAVTSAGNESVTVRKGADGWALVEPTAAGADQTEVNGLAQSLASLRVQRVVDENPADVAQYGLDPARVEVGFRAAGDAAMTRLLLGDRTPTGSEVYARTAGESRVFLVSSYLESTFTKSPFDLRDKRILIFERDTVTGLDVTHGNSAVALTREDGAWRLSRPIQASADYSTAEGVIGQIQSARMTSLAASDAPDLAAYGLDRPALTASVVTGDGRRTLEIGTPAPDGGVYARDTSRSLVFTIAQALVTELETPAADYRRKDLFDFRSFNASRFELTRGGTTRVFEKSAAEGDSTTDTWRQVAPTTGDIDSAMVETALSQLSGLRIESFADPASTGEAVATVQVRFGDGPREERAIFHRAGTDVYATRVDEPGAARLDAAAFDSALAAFDAVQ